MAHKLLIIESPNKIKTLSKYLGNEYEIIATVGHIRDLSRFGMGFNIEDFTPKWVVNGDDKKKIIEQIKSSAKKLDEIYIATDPDREGEAIAWHIYDILEKEEQKKCKRITFNEITKKAVQESFDNKREINESWVHSQFARRIIDRLIGFRLSQLVQSKLKAESAGRVQSVALKFIADREKEIREFVSVPWFNIDVLLTSELNLTLVELSKTFLNVEKQESIKRTGFNFKLRSDADNVFKVLSDEYVVIKISDPSIITTSPKPPYKTSTLQQDGINKLNMSSKQITSISQRLYEGIEIDGVHSALISYPRTDSIRLSNDFIEEGKQVILNKYGAEYLGKTPVYVAKSGVQDAHEAIRPVDITLTPDSLKSKIPKREWDLYNLVWLRTLAYLMQQASFKRITINLENNDNKFNVSSRECTFKGYLILWDKEDIEDDLSINLKDFEVGSIHKSKTQNVSDHETSPPPRFTQASLIKSLEAAGVGRPSTYNSMANISLDRGYAVLDAKSFTVTEIGESVINQLNNFFSEEINKDFTKKMEEHLDKIASGDELWTSWLSDFSPKFDAKIKYARENMEKVPDEKVGRECPTCQSDLVFKTAKKFGTKFIGCSGYPTCKYLEPLEKPKTLDDICPLEGSNLIIRKNKKGSEFIACTGFPKCRYLLSMKDYKNHLETAPGTPFPIIEKPEKKSKTKK